MDGSRAFGFKRQWLAEHLIDRERAMSVGDALSFIGSVAMPEKVSAHPYNQSALKLLEAVERSGGMALDCGAGKRDFTAEHLIQTDIAPLPNIDVLCDGQTLPFRDACFDLVLSFDVLEHVANPFLAAAETKRVLKPGGVVYVDAPHIVTEHGYPSHYFNMTRFGLRKLFEGMECDAHAVPQSGHPTQALRTVLANFRAGLPRTERAAFDKMTVAELLAQPPKEMAKTLCQNFHPDVRWKVAATTCALFRKPGESLLEFDVGDLPQFLHRDSRPIHMPV